MCQNTTMRVYGARIKRYCVLCSKNIVSAHATNRQGTFIFSESSLHSFLQFSTWFIWTILCMDIYELLVDAQDFLKGIVTNYFWWLWMPCRLTFSMIRVTLHWFRTVQPQVRCGQQISCSSRLPGRKPCCAASARSPGRSGSSPIRSGYALRAIRQSIDALQQRPPMQRIIRSRR